MSPAITSGFVLTVLFTSFILFSKTTIDNSVEISQDVNNAAVMVNEKLNTNLVMTNVRILDGCNFEATVKNQGTTNIENFTDMSLLVEFPEEAGVNNENIVLNYTTLDSLNPGEWTHSINPNLNHSPFNDSGDVNSSWSHDGSKIVFASNRDTNDTNFEIYSINVHGGNETRLTNNLTNDQFPSWSPDGTKIVFATNRDGNYEIYTMNADGTNQTNVTNHPTTDYYPTWSHDGTKIAFTSWRDGNSEIYTMNADGTNQINISNNIKEDSSPSWAQPLSFVGTKIVFQSNRDGNWEIYTMWADGTNQYRITNASSDEGYPVWSPDGTKVVFQSFIDGNNELYFMDHYGSNPTRITTNSSSDRNATWAHDGTKVAFETDRDGNDEIYFSDLPDTSHITQILENGFEDSAPRWSHDGTKVAFESLRDGNWEIFTMNPDGTNLTNVTNNASIDGNASWSPDGTKIVFHTYRDGNWEIYTMNADGTNLTKVTNNSFLQHRSPSWSPDGNQLAFASTATNNGISSIDTSKPLKQRKLHNLTNDNYDNLSEKFSENESEVLNPGETMNIIGRATLSTGTSTDPRWLISLVSDTGVKTSRAGSQMTYIGPIYRTPDNRSLFGTADTVLYNKNGWIPVQSLDDQWITTSGAAEIVLDHEGNTHGIVGESYLDLELPYDGGYVIEVGSNGTIRPGNSNSIGNYNISLHNQYNDHATPTIGDSSFEGSPVPQGAEEINPGEWKFGEINTDDDVDWWQFDGAKGQQVTIKISYTNHQSIADWVSGLEGFTFKLYNYRTSESINC
jgi:Tol biopolymer transport system component